MEKMLQTGLYCHWPFCPAKCPYCDFRSYPFRFYEKNFDEDVFLKAYARDLEIYPKDRPLTSLFFGGGTPSMMPISLLDKILNLCADKCHFASDIEISLEANPDAVTYEKMKQFKSLGINRLSLGVQALNESDLRFFRRTHSLERAREAVFEMKSVFKNASIDLIYARPHQTWEEWHRELEEALSFDLPHISLYELTFEDGTPFARDKSIRRLSENKSLVLLKKTWTYLKNHGIPAYEISNFARKGFECRHNLLYWQGGDYIGIGPASHGRIGLKATAHAPDILGWLAEKEVPTEVLTPEEREEEKVMMGLRLMKGCPPSSLVSDDSLQKALSEGLLSKRALPNYCPTVKGRSVLNKLTELLLIGE